MRVLLIKRMSDGLLAENESLLKPRYEVHEETTEGETLGRYQWLLIKIGPAVVFNLGNPCSVEFWP